MSSSLRKVLCQSMINHNHKTDMQQAPKEATSSWHFPQTMFCLLQEWQQFSEVGKQQGTWHEKKFSCYYIDVSDTTHSKFLNMQKQRCVRDCSQEILQTAHWAAIWVYLVSPVFLPFLASCYVTMCSMQLLPCLSTTSLKFAVWIAELLSNSRSRNSLQDLINYNSRH